MNNDKELRREIYKQRMDGVKLDRHPCRAVNSNGKACLNNCTSKTFYLCGSHKNAKKVRYSYSEYKEVIKDMERKKIAGYINERKERVVAGFAAMSYESFKAQSK